MGLEVSEELAQELLAQLLYPWFTRAFSGAVESVATFSHDLGDYPAIDLDSVRKKVGGIESTKKRQHIVHKRLLTKV